MKEALKELVRRVHVTVRDRGLPEQVGVALHSLKPEYYETFEEMVKYFLGCGYVFTEPSEFASEGSCGRRILLSFDDNFQTWHQSLPLLESLGIKVTFYVNTLPLRDRARGEVIADYYRRIRQPGGTTSLTTTELRELAAMGHTIGSHTYSHPDLRALPFEEAAEDVRRGKAELEDILGARVEHFAYPYGMGRHFSRKLREYCAGIGFVTIANGVPGLLHRRQELRSINRTGWDLKRPLRYNLASIRADGAWLEALTGRSAV